jgi:hypothetical protein
VVLERKLTLDDARLTLAVLEVLAAGPEGAGAEALIELSDWYWLWRVDKLLAG